MHALTTIVAPTRQDRLAALDALIDALGNPAREEVRTELAKHEATAGIHFMSLHAIPHGDGPDAFILLEYTADGSDEAVIAALVAAIGTDLEPIFAEATDRKGTDLAEYLSAHRIRIGHGLLANPGLAFAGTPGMTVTRIRREAALADALAGLVEQEAGERRPIDWLRRVRAAVARSEHAWALEAPPPPPGEGRERAALARIAGLAGPAARTYLWPIGAIALAAFVLALLMGEDLGDALGTAAMTLLVLGLAAAAAALALYLGLRRQEARDWTDERMPDPATIREIGLRENHAAHNHMISVTTRKPGPVRWFTLRLAFWAIATLARQEFKPGHLGSIASIHAARWITIPRTRLLVFLSNYGGSWESYLEDFITRASNGLTGVWSNCIGFPRARNLFLDGATDGERFKRYARASMRPTRFWYSAYPDLTTFHVRRNATLRRGLAAALTNDEAKDWLALFGSAPLPPAKLESHEIQSIVFGGLGFLPEGTCLLYDLPEDPEAARRFVAALPPETAFGDGRRLRRDAVLVTALGAGALARLGLPASCLGGFPTAFLEGMGTATRCRILGDTGRNAPSGWRWGGDPPDLALIVYGETPEAVAALEDRLAAHATASGMAPPHRIPLEPVAESATEPFGFVDGVSQPIIRGTYASYRNNDPIHLVQPGEFVIGYPDDRGNLPPEPYLSALRDPENRLPVAERSPDFAASIVDAPRAVARNGTYLVIRQLEQDPDAFWSYCRAAAEAIAPHFGEPYHVDADFVAAKLVGRWKDGASLVRNPYHTYAEEQVRREARHKRRPAPPVPRADAPATEDSAGDERPNDDGLARPETSPPQAEPIAAPTREQGRADNDFLYGVEDPRGVRCPLGAHIRRANPRDSLDPGSKDQIAISNRHRILRVGRLYRPEAGAKPGLLFMCLNGDIERQFEFIQQTWLVSPTFHGLSGEQDPLTSNDDRKGVGFAVPTQQGPVRLKPLPHFVRTLGGGYFFVPSRSLLAFLAGPTPEPAARAGPAPAP